MASKRTICERTDGELMRRVQADDIEAFAELYDRHGGRAFRVARVVCRDAGQAEDAVQDGFLAIWRGRASYRSAAGGFRPWAMSIVRNRAIDSTRKAASRPRLHGGENGTDRQEAPGEVIPDAMTAEDDRDAMLGSLRLLPDAQAEVVVLAFYGELSHSEIADRLGLPPGTVKGRMRLGLKKLRLDMATH
jgi:RNA polymerase sigma-70 factor, ECF subfamily